MARDRKWLRMRKRCRLRVSSTRFLAFTDASFENAFFENFANFWRARSRLYQNEILQETMRLTEFFKLYKICLFCTAAILTS